jgi:hypothetical protein
MKIASSATTKISVVSSKVRPCFGIAREAPSP